MFIDEVVVTVKAGNGGDGSAAFRREKYIQFGATRRWRWWKWRKCNIC